MTADQFEKVKKLIPFMKELLDTDVTITILAEGKVQYVDHAKGFTMQSEPGDLVPENDPVYEVLRTKKSGHYEIPKELFGVSIYGKYIPYYDENGEYICVIATAFSMEKEIALRESAESISSSLEETSATVTSYSEEVKNLADSVVTLTEFIENVEKGTRSVSNLVKDIKANAARSKILALNATIEAARTGEAGKGFAIVAKEMGILANASNESSEKINKSIVEMLEQIKLIVKDIENINDVVSSQTESIDGISNAIEIVSEESQQMFSMTTNKK